MGRRRHATGLRAARSKSRYTQSMDLPRRDALLSSDLPPVRRLGLASRGNTNLTADDVHRAIAAGVNYLNWCGQSDGMSRAIAELGPKRKDIVIAAQLSAESRAE